MLLNHRRGLALALVALAAAIVLAVLMVIPGSRASIDSIDEWVYRTVDGSQLQVGVWLATALSFIGGGIVTWPVRIGVLALLAWRRRWLQFAAFALAVVTSELLLGLMKQGYHRARPPNPLITTTGYSFPSGHAVASVVTAVGVVIVLLPPGRSRLRWESIAIAFAAVMALSRVYLNAHWLFDVVEGALIGAAVVLLFPAALQSIRSRVRPKVTAP